MKKTHFQRWWIERKSHHWIVMVTSVSALEICWSKARANAIPSGYYPLLKTYFFVCPSLKLMKTWNRSLVLSKLNRVSGYMSSSKPTSKSPSSLMRSVNSTVNREVMLSGYVSKELSEGSVTWKWVMLDFRTRQKIFDSSAGHSRPETSASRCESIFHQARGDNNVRDDDMTGKQTDLCEHDYNT